MLARGVSQCAHCERSTRLQTRSLINYLYARNAAFPSPFFSSPCFRLAIKSRCSQPFITVKGPTTRSREHILTTGRLYILRAKKQKKWRGEEIWLLFRRLPNYDLPRTYVPYCRKVSKFIRHFFFFLASGKNLVS